ncbi:MAG: PilZ domain-containing protein [Myxococcota bacterium]
MCENSMGDEVASHDPELRHFPRYAVEVNVEFLSPSGSTFGHTRNVSRHGLSAEVSRPLPPGLKLHVRMSLVFGKDSFSEPLQLPVRIVWCTPIGDTFQIGMAFASMSNDQKGYLSMFLRYLDAGNDSGSDPSIDEEPFRDADGST